MRFHHRHDKDKPAGWGKILVAFVFLGSLFLGVSSSQQWERAGKEYPDGHGGTVYFPAGDLSFADEVISFQKGNPAAGDADSQPEETLGSPFVLLPIVNHDNNQHGENENLRLANLWDGIELYAGVLARLGSTWAPQP